MQSLTFLKRGQTQQAVPALITINPEPSNPLRTYQHQWFVNAVVTWIYSQHLPLGRCGIKRCLAPKSNKSTHTIEPKQVFRFTSHLAGCPPTRFTNTLVQANGWEPVYAGYNANMLISASLI